MSQFLIAEACMALGLLVLLVALAAVIEAIPFNPFLRRKGELEEWAAQLKKDQPVKAFVFDLAGLFGASLIAFGLAYPLLVAAMNLTF